MARTPPISVDAMSFGCRCKLKAEESYTVPFCTNDVTALNEPYSHTALTMGNRELIRSALYFRFSYQTSLSVSPLGPTNPSPPSPTL